MTAAESFNATELALARMDPAFALCAVALRGGLRKGHKGELLARALPKVASEIAAYRRQFESGNAAGLLHAIACCAREVLPLPTWAATALLDRLGQYEAGKLPTLDEALGAPHPAGGKAAQRSRRDWQLGIRLWAATVTAQHEHGMTTLDEALRHAIKAERSRVGPTKARELVLAVEAVQSRHIGPRLMISQLKRKTRKT